MTRIALVVEGKSGVDAVPILIRSAGGSVHRVLKFDGQGVGAAVSVLVQKCLLPATSVAVLGKPDKVVVVLDLEARNVCPGAFARDIERELIKQLSVKLGEHNVPIAVVFSVRMLENWLVADPDGFAAHANVARNVKRRVGGNADSADALAIIQWSMRRGRSYQKGRDAASFAQRVRTNDSAVRKRSRSLDKLLREVGL